MAQIKKIKAKLKRDSIHYSTLRTKLGHLDARLVRWFCWGSDLYWINAQLVVMSLLRQLLNIPRSKELEEIVRQLPSYENDDPTVSPPRVRALREEMRGKYLTQLNRIVNRVKNH